MAENFPQTPEDSKIEKKKESDYNKAQRIKESLMKLEKSLVDEVDEATQSARGSIKAMGFGMTPLQVTDDEDEA